MSKSDFTVSIEVDRPASAAFDAINNVSRWWQGEFEGGAAKLNDEFIYRMEDIHLSTQKVVELVPNKRVVWLITKSKLSFTKKADEWTGTKIIFDLTEKDGKTKIVFTHAGLTSAFECYDACSNAWGLLVKKSLHSLITTGKGLKVFS